MRRVVFALVILLVCASAATGVRVHASTECERWLAEYREAIAHSPAVKRAAAARHRLHHYLHRKIAALRKTAPAKPHVLAARFHRPKLTRQELRHKFDLACGDLPEDLAAEGILPDEPGMTFAMAGRHPADEMALDPDSPATLLAMNETPSYFGGGSPSSGWSPTMWAPGFGAGAGGGGGPRTPTVTGTGGTPAVPAAPAPEPGSLLLLGTGIAGLAFGLRYKMAGAD